MITEDASASVSANTGGGLVSMGLSNGVLSFARSRNVSLSAALTQVPPTNETSLKRGTAAFPPLYLSHEKATHITTFLRGKFSFCFTLGFASRVFCVCVRLYVYALCKQVVYVLTFPPHDRCLCSPQITQHVTTRSSHLTNLTLILAIRSICEHGPAGMRSRKKFRRWSFWRFS